MSAPKKANHHTQKTVSFRLPEGLMAQLRILAKASRRTLSGELQIAIEEHLKRQVTRPADGFLADGES
jgi:predicted transcriptional regulator